jgi:hypothetical protein
MHVSSQLSHWGAALPGEIHICRNTGIPAKSVNYFYGNMKDAQKWMKLKMVSLSTIPMTGFFVKPGATWKTSAASAALHAS